MIKPSLKTIFSCGMIYLFIVPILPGVISIDAEAGSIYRERDCGGNPDCIKEYSKGKEEWLSCLEAAGLSEKKRGKLASRVERFGIRNLKKQEFLIFNSKRKTCHKIFKDTLSKIDSDTKDSSSWPPPLDHMMDQLPNGKD